MLVNASIYGRWLFSCINHITFFVDIIKLVIQNNRSEVFGERTSKSYNDMFPCFHFVDVFVKLICVNVVGLE